MPRRKIVKREDVYKLRGEAWQNHYQNREAVRAMSKQVDAARITWQLIRYLPAPEMGIDGGLLDYPIDIRREYLHGKILPESLFAFALCLVLVTR